MLPESLISVANKVCRSRLNGFSTGSMLGQFGTVWLCPHTHKAQLKLFGPVLRAPENCLERNCCFTKSLLYRGGVVGSGIRRGRPRIHWAEQCAIQAWHWLQDLPNPSMQRHPKFPFVFVQLHRLAVRRQFWSRLVELRTCRKYLKKTCYIAFSQ